VSGYPARQHSMPNIDRGAWRCEFLLLGPSRSSTSLCGVGTTISARSTKRQDPKAWRATEANISRALEECQQRLRPVRFRTGFRMAAREARTIGQKLMSIARELSVAPEPMLPAYVVPVRQKP
jgi:hypothetical protein